MSKSIYQVIKEIQDYFKYRKPLHLSFGRKIVPSYVVNMVPEFKQYTETVAAVQNTWYDLFDDAKVVTSIDGCKELSNVDLIRATIIMATLGETVEVNMEIDGVSYTGSLGAGAGDLNSVLLSTGDATTLAIANALYNFGINCSVKCRSLRCRFRKTTANGANNLTMFASVQEYVG